MNSAVEMFRGDSYPLKYVIRDRDTRKPVSLTGCQMTMTVSSDKNPANEEAILFTVAGVLGLDAGTVSFTPSPENTNIEPARYYYDVQLTNALSHVRTLVKDSFTITQDITK